MSTRFSFHQGPPAEAEVYKRVKFVVTEHGTFWIVKAWRGKALKPFNHYRVDSEAKLAGWIDGIKRGEDADEARRATRKLDAAAETEKMKAALQIGALLHYSWGYEQTQCEFYEVVGRTAGTVTIREIAAKTVEGSGYANGMADRRLPVPGVFIGPPMKKVIRGSALSMDHGVATLTRPDQAHYCTWYH